MCFFVKIFLKYQIFDVQYPDSASSQFFIMHEDAPHLDAQYAAFGRVTSGMEVVDKIAGVKTGRYGFYSDVPRTCIVITDATVAE